MGLDIYVRWGDEDEDGNSIGFPKEAYEAQMTGFADAPEAGYMRYNWQGTSAVEKIARATGAPQPIYDLYPEWSGGNGDEFFITDSEMQRLLLLQERITTWTRNANPATFDNVPDFPGEDKEKLQKWFVGKLAGTSTMITFIRQNADKPKLRICFF